MASELDGVWFAIPEWKDPLSMASFVSVTKDCDEELTRRVLEM